MPWLDDLMDGVQLAPRKHPVDDPPPATPHPIAPVDEPKPPGKPVDEPDEEEEAPDT
jgi:hypothetical protein